MITLLAFLKCFPEMFALFQTLEAAAKEAETERKVSEDIKTIHGAFSAKDPTKLNALFVSR
jgi:hypothetical protein